MLRSGTPHDARARRLALLRRGPLVLATALLALTGCQQGAVAPSESGDAAPPPSTTAPAPSATPTPESVDVTVSAMGDMLPHDSVVADARTADGYDFGRMFDAARGIWADSDVVVCNQETPSAPGLGIHYFPAFNAPPEFAEGLADAGCTAIGLGNNHTFDRGQAGIDGTRAVWDELDPALISGANRSAEEQQVVTTTEVDGLRIAFVNFVDLSNNPTPEFSVNWLTDDAVVESLMATARESADAVIVAVHWGEEYSPVSGARQHEQAQRLADLGADVIFGTHPHVLQDAEWIERADGGRSFVYYSIGNALSTQMAVPRVVSAVAQVTFRGEPGGDVEVVDPSAVPIYMHFDLTPAQFAAGDWVHRRNLQLYPLADAAEAITRSAWRNELTVESGFALVEDVLGPDVRIIDDSFAP